MRHAFAWTVTEAFTSNPLQRVTRTIIKQIWIYSEWNPTYSLLIHKNTVSEYRIRNSNVEGLQWKATHTDPYKHIVHLGLAFSTCFIIVFQTLKDESLQTIINRMPGSMKLDFFCWSTFAFLTFSTFCFWLISNLLSLVDTSIQAILPASERKNQHLTIPTEPSTYFFAIYSHNYIAASYYF